MADSRSRHHVRYMTTSQGHPNSSLPDEPTAPGDRIPGKNAPEVPEKPTPEPETPGKPTPQPDTPAQPGTPGPEIIVPQRQGGGGDVVHRPKLPEIAPGMPDPRPPEPR